nr:hypothetical protein [Yersinia aleksiciae]
MSPEMNILSSSKNKTLSSYLIVLAIVFFMMMSPLSSADNRPGFVCGKFNGHVMEVPEEYIIYWAEYEGKSSWTPGFTKNKKGCDANFMSLPMITSWPDMQPGNQSKWYVQKMRFEGLKISAKPLMRPDVDITYMRDFYLEKRKDKEIDPVIYLDDLEMFFVKVTTKLMRSERPDKNDPYWPYWFDEDINGYYWPEVNGRIPVIFSCEWHPLEKRDFYCIALFVMSEIGARVEVKFTPEKLPQWRKIVSNTQQFLLSHIKR